MSDRPEFCIDCGHERSMGEQIISVTPDHGWTAEFAAPLDGGEKAFDTETRGPDGSRWNTWTEPVIGWAVVERHFAGVSETGHDRGIEPVLLTEGQFPVTMTDYRDDRNMDKVCTRITRTGEPPAPGGGQLRAMTS